MGMIKQFVGQVFGLGLSQESQNLKAHRNQELGTFTGDVNRHVGTLEQITNEHIAEANRETARQLALQEAIKKDARHTITQVNRQCRDGIILIENSPDEGSRVVQQGSAAVRISTTVAEASERLVPEAAKEAGAEALKQANASAKSSRGHLQKGAATIRETTAPALPKALKGRSPATT